MDKETTRVDSTRVVLPLFQADDDGSIPISPLHLRIGRISIERAKALNHAWHSQLPIFETGFCQNGWAYGAEYKNRYYAVAIWSNPVALNLPQQAWLELRRFAIAPDAPKNTASRLLRIMRTRITRDFPLVERLVSYQDEDRHLGTIYKASGWVPTHRHAGGSWSRPMATNLNGSSRTRPDLNGATGPKIRWEYSLTSEARARLPLGP